jgi:hypothetical protein
VSRDAQGRGDVVEDGLGRVVDELLVDHGHVAAAHGHPGHVLAVGQDPAPRGAGQTGHDAQERRLAGLGSAQQHVTLAGLEIEGNVLEVRFAVDDAVDGIKLKPHAAPPWAGWDAGFGARRHVRMPVADEIIFLN